MCFAILRLLAARKTFLEELAYLYNGIYILPLLLVLAAVSTRSAALAATMIGMGAILLAVSL